ncbi:CHAT domain-containing protein, partial [Crepidotus variabilis]
MSERNYYEFSAKANSALVSPNTPLETNSTDNISLHDVLIECLPDDASYDAFHTMVLITIGAKEVVNSSPLLQRASPTTWKYNGKIEFSQDLDEIVMIVQSQDIGDLGFLTLTKEEVVKHSAARNTAIGFKHDIVMEPGFPTLWLKFVAKQRNEEVLNINVANPTKSPLPQVKPATSITDLSSAIEHFNIGQASFRRFKGTGDISEISSAIDYQQVAVALTPENHPLLPSYLDSLGISFASRFERTGDLSDISTAIEHMQTAVLLTPENSSSLPSYSVNLGTSFSIRFKRTGNLDDISNAIGYLEKAVSNIPTGQNNANMPLYLSNLGTSLKVRFERTGDLVDIGKAIEYQQQAISLTPEGNINMPSFLGNLGNSFLSCFKRAGSTDDLSNAIKHLEKAVLSCSDRNPNMPLYLGNLGMSYSVRFKRIGNLADISSAISYLHKAVQLIPEGHPMMLLNLENLGVSYSCRFERLGNLADISEAIEHGQKAVLLTPEGHADLPRRLANLGGSLSTRFERSGNVADISSAIEHQKKAVELTPDGHPSMPVYLDNLGASFSRRYDSKKMGDLADIACAIKHLQRAALITPEGHPNMPTYLVNLGSIFYTRFERTRDLADISSAIDHQQKAILLAPEDHVNIPSYLGGLGQSLLARFQQTRNFADISSAIDHLRKAAQLTPEEYADLPVRLGYLAIAYLNRFMQFGDLEDISKSIEHGQKAIVLTPEGHPTVLSYLGNIGVSYVSRFERTGDVADISSAIEYVEKAVAHTPEGHGNLASQVSNLGTSFFHRFECTRDLDDLNKAVEYHQKGAILTPKGHPDNVARLGSLGSSQWKRYQETKQVSDRHASLLNFRLGANQSTGPPIARLKIAKKWARCAIEAQDPVESLEAFDVAVELLSLVASLYQTVQNRYTNLLDISDLVTEAAVCALDNGSTDKALEWLEQGRCLVWNQLNQLRSPVDDLRASDAELADQFLAVSKSLESSGSRSDLDGLSVEMPLIKQVEIEREVSLHVKRVQEWTHLLAEIRNLPGFGDFLRPPKAANIFARLPKEGSVVVINIHAQRCDALALVQGAQSALHIPLTSFSLKRAEELCHLLRNHLEEKDLRMRDNSYRAIRRVKPKLEKRNVLLHVLRELWECVVWPILEGLGHSVPPAQRSHIWWCPTGLLTFLPLHAAGLYGEEAAQNPSLGSSCVSDFVLSSYIPTVSTLLEKLKIPESPEQAKRSDMKVLLISQPNTPRCTPIPATTEETQLVLKKLKKRGVEALLLENDEATSNRVIEQMASHGWVHFACHASQDPLNPLKSGFYLHDLQLSLSTIIQQHQLPNAEFAFLSACQTSVGDEKWKEEAVHVAAGMLAAGYRGVVATMWGIRDDVAVDVAEGFYECVLEQRARREREGGVGGLKKMES